MIALLWRSVDNKRLSWTGVQVSLKSVVSTLQIESKPYCYVLVWYLETVLYEQFAKAFVLSKFNRNYPAMKLQQLGGSSEMER